MGHAKKPKKKYETPMHPWNKARIEEERSIARTYGTVNKTELYKMATILKRIKDQVKKLTPLTGSQAEKETAQLKQKLVSLGLLQQEQEVDDALGIALKDVMERRLQTLVFRKGLARSMKQARQFITHGHILINGNKTTSPSYLVRTDEEHSLQFMTTSPFTREDHPERSNKSELVQKNTLEAQEQVAKKKEESMPKKRPGKRRRRT
ncbi:MAG: 30S ribosomal protein S4 [archaeon]